MSELKQLYKVRFSQEEEKKKNLIWAEICKYLKKILTKDYAVVVDVAAGYCEFINNFSITGAKYAIDANPAITDYAKRDVKAYNATIERLKEYFEKDSVSLFFMSNFLEHINKKQISQLLKDEYDLLHEGGQVCILTPNIKYVGEKYWDFFDHVTPITERALIEEAESIGYRTRLCVNRFLPFSTKSKSPQTPEIVKIYFMFMPLSGKIFGEQSLLVFEKMEE